MRFFSTTSELKMNTIIPPQELKHLAFLLKRPLHFNALALEITSRCNARCAMCYQSAGPSGSAQFGKTALSAAELDKILLEAAQLKNLSSRVHFGGGEAFLNIPVVLALIASAQRAGFRQISTVTNAFWARNPARALQICQELKKAGLTYMEISWDYWHLAFIPPQAVNNCLVACAKAGITTELRLLSTKAHSFEECLAFLDPQCLALAGSITGSPVNPIGRGAALDSADIFDCYDPAQSCHNDLNLTINPSGSVYPCCNGLDQTSILQFGNIRDNSLAEIVAAMEQSLILKTIVFDGIAVVANILQKRGFKIDPNPKNICHQCWTIFSRPEHLEALRAYFFSLQLAALTNSPHGLI